MGVKFLGGMHMSNNQLLENDEVKYVPKLRFTEFKDNPSWKSKTIGDFVSSHIGGASITPNDFVEFSNYEVLPKKSVTNGKWLQTDNLEPTYCTQVFFEKNQKNIVDSSYVITTLRDLVPTGPNIGFIARYSGHKKYLLAQGVYGLKLNKLIVPDFLIFYSQTGVYRRLVQSVMVGSTQVHIRNNVFLNLPIYIPSLSEQEKISTCLSSLEELIHSESRKLEAHKQHKNGLLQQLFPKNGENFPKLRLGKFSQEWKAVELSQIAKAVKKKNSTGDEIKVLSLSNEHGLVSQADYFLKKVAGDNTERYIVLKKNDFVYNDRITKNSTYGTIKRLSLYKSGIVSPIYKCFRFEKNQNPVFWEYFFESKTHESEIKQIVNEGARAGRYNISIDKFLTINVMQPSLLEQEKIASCLTSLDYLISNQTNYIEQLKKHKTGLMQQLFPVVEEI